MRRREHHAGAPRASRRKDGTVTIKSKDVAVDASGDATFGAGKDIVLKGQKILEN